MSLWPSDPKPQRQGHDKVLMSIVQDLMRKGVRILFVDAKGFNRPDIIYQTADGKLVGLDIKTKKGHLVKTEREIK